MRLTVVGCSGSVPGPDSASSCYLVEQDGYRLLLDLGTGSAGPLQRYCAPEQVDAVLISHAHNDHYYDLNALSYLRQRVGAGPLDVYGPANLPGALGWTDEAVLRLRTVTPPGPLPLGPFEVRVAAVAHGMESYAYRVGDGLCFTGDTAPCAELDKLAEGCSVLLAEACGYEPDSVPRHLSAADAGLLAARAGARLLVLTHLRSWLDHERLLAEASAVAGCPVLLASPGLRLQA
ncbi:MBL fold metallo-hydrolase [Catellatospora tritici]|uniref:MBL fold metallo-hydrolase n=1 Tax=Catellatospora tritici TaxID=2851566 RepID=UPI001C2D489A|nr:MBL fold metallo-hydrolase [Catellatospora tritici]MBV1854500.1 MBL fold metallo-hydrolase [Catellatospora tritici]